MKLMVVESPNKVKKIESILGDGWKVVASVGHVRDLPKHDIGLEAPDFALQYEYIPPAQVQGRTFPGGEERVARIRALSGRADMIFLATDPDREGEAIAWHLKDALGLDEGDYERVTFDEITEKAIRAALSQARKIDADARARGAEIPLPTDVVVAPAFAADAPATIKAVDAVGADDMILDIGPQTAAQYAGLIARAGTVVWNGPVGVFEFDAFGKGTEALARAIAASSAFSIAGGGDTLAAVDKYGIAGEVSYISTGGGAFLEFLEGKTLPAVAALEARGS